MRRSRTDLPPRHGTRLPERGLSLVEVVVAMALLATAVISSVSAIDASAGATRSVERRARAALIAQSELEAMRSAPYTAVGLSPASPGYVPTFEGRATVATEATAFSPSVDIVQTGTTYHVVRQITWGDVTLSGGRVVPGALKVLTVVVTWTDGGTRTVRVDGAVSPSVRGAECARRWVDTAPGTLSGVLNSYIPVTSPSAAGTSSLSVGAGYRAGGGAAIAPGDLVLVIQMGGLPGGGAGRYEYALATTAVTGGTLGVTGVGAFGGLVNGYGSDGPAQVVRVPTFGDAVVGVGLAAARWDGTTGGVLALDVAGTLRFGSDVDLSGTGLGVPRPAGSSVDPGHLLAGSGSGDPGGGLVVIRAQAATGAGRIRSDGAPGVSGGGGGTVVVATENGGLSPLRVSARGAAPGGASGALLASSPPASYDLSGAGAPTADTSMRIEELVGVGLGVGCEPAITVAARTTTPVVTTAPGPTIRYTVTVNAAPGRGGTTDLQIAALPALGYRYSSTASVTLGGGALRLSSVDPRPGDTTPRWGTFFMPAGSSVQVSFVVSVPAGATPGVLPLDARGSYSVMTGPRVATYPAASGTAEDVTVVRP